MEDLVALGRELQSTAEPGFFEFRTHALLSARFREAGFTVEEFPGMPGFSATADGRLSGKSLALIADMDGLPSGGGGYAHLCGHHQQMAALLGTALRLREASPALLSRTAFLAVPAEEYVELERREELRSRGGVERLSGKQELIRRGAFRGFRWVISTHSSGITGPRAAGSVLAMNGFDVLRFAFRGRAAHAGSAPHLGRNAQNAACLFLQACAFLRETFPEDRHIRIHPVMRLKPDQAVNLIPDAAFVESYARALDDAAVEETAGKLAAAAGACGAALGVEVDTERLPGYAAFHADPALSDALRASAAETGAAFVEEGFSAASSDMGDVSRVVPSVMVGLPGSNGLLHNPEFRITDEEAAYRFPAEILAVLVRRVLTGG
jgi:amidohydrolase